MESHGRATVTTSNAEYHDGICSNALWDHLAPPSSCETPPKSVTSCTDLSVCTAKSTFPVIFSISCIISVSTQPLHHTLHSLPSVYTVDDITCANLVLQLDTP
ncbi:hypothetical protein BsWGS_11434 [Bradybaena similaris]